jgi:hypothetical protein
MKDYDGNHPLIRMLQRVGGRCEPMRTVGCTLSRVGLVNAKASNETRLPPLQGRALIGAFE